MKITISRGEKWNKASKIQIGKKVARLEEYNLNRS
jgi:hypothetical protein